MTDIRALHNQVGKRRSVYQSIKICNLQNQNKWGGIAQSAWGEFILAKQGKHAEQWNGGAGKQARLQVFTHTHSSSFNRTLAWVLVPPFLHQGHFSSLPWHRVLQEQLPEQWCLLPFVRLHIAADHRDMQRAWINYLMGNSRTAAETFSTAWKWKPGVDKKNNEIPGEILLRFSRNRDIREFL